MPRYQSYRVGKISVSSLAPRVGHVGLFEYQIPLSPIPHFEASLS